MQNTQSYCYIYPKASQPYIFCSPDYTVNKLEKKSSVTNSCIHQPHSQVFCSFQLLAPEKEKPLRKKLC